MHHKTGVSLRELRTFLMVASCSTYNEAAKRLTYSPSAISLQVSSLESTLGVRLFQRRNRVQLTDEGRRLLPYAEKIIALCDEMGGQFSPQG